LVTGKDVEGKLPDGSVIVRRDESRCFASLPDYNVNSSLSCGQRAVAHRLQDSAGWKSAPPFRGLGSHMQHRAARAQMHGLFALHLGNRI